MLSEIAAFKNQLESDIGRTVEVVLSPPSKSAKGSVQLWLWRIEEDSAVRLPRPTPELTNPLPPKLRCLVFATDIALLQQIRDAALRSPIVASEHGSIQVQPDNLSEELLLNLFIAARIALRPCLAYVLRTS
jgi:hypothetical protein